MSLETNALSVTYSLTEFNPSMKSAPIRGNAASTFAASERQIGATIYLVRRDYTEPLSKLIRSIRGWLDDRCFKIEGTRFLSATAYTPVTKFVREQSQTFDQLRAEFTNNWDQIRSDSVAALGGLPYNPKLLNLTAAQVADQIGFTFGKALISGPAAVAQMRGLDAQIRAEMEAELAAQHAAIEAAAREQARARVASVLRAVSAKLSTFDPEKGRIHDSLLGNLKDIADLIPSIIIGDDPALLEVCAKAQGLVAWDKELLRENATARRDVIDRARSLLADIGSPDLAPTVAAAPLIPPLPEPAPLDPDTILAGMAL